MFNFHISSKSNLTIFVFLVILMGCSEPPETTVSPDEKQSPLNKPQIQFTALSTHPNPAWLTRHAIDGNPVTAWSSNTHGTSQPEWIIYHNNGGMFVNYIKILPRYDNNIAISWPTNFTISTFDGTNWTDSYPYENFPPPSNNSWLYLPVLNTNNINGSPKTIYKIKIDAHILGKDDVDNYVFQLHEIQPGFDTAYSKFKFIGNDPLLGSWNEIRNVGAGLFDINKLSNWHYDIRNPLIEALPCDNPNIYAPSIIYDNGTWNIYFGGWDGTNDGFDRISKVTTNDDFLSLSEHDLKINHGVFKHVNNASVIKLPDNSWRMYYTTLLVNEIDPLRNKPAYATSMDGSTWNPFNPDVDDRITMSNYRRWENADVNGLNAIYYDQSDNKYYLYWGDNNNINNYGTYCATSNGNDGKDFTNIGRVLITDFLTGPKMTDIKLIQNYYVLAGSNTFVNGENVYISYSTQLTTGFLNPPQVIFSKEDQGDRITTVGLVTANNILYGVIYGRCTNDEWNDHDIKAAWLQKEVRFINNFHTYGIGEKAFGPNIIRMELASQIETGKFKIYDTDYNGNPNQQPNFVSPLLTMREGDIWEYKP